MIDWRHFDTEGGSIAVKTVTAANAIKNANASVGVEAHWAGMMPLPRWRKARKLDAYPQIHATDTAELKLRDTSIRYDVQRPGLAACAGATHEARESRSTDR